MKPSAAFRPSSTVSNYSQTSTSGWLRSSRGLHSVHEYFASVEREVENLPAEQRMQVLGRLQEARSLIGPVDALAQLVLWKSPRER